MKTILTILTTLTLSYLSYGQKAMTFNESKKINIRISHLDSIYLSGIHSATSLAVFKTNQYEYISAYKKLLQDCEKNLLTNNFLLEKPQKILYVIYFDKNGKIDYFLYSFRPDQLTEEQEKRFGELLSEFIVDYRFSLTATTGFAQCSPVTYMSLDK